MNGNPDYEMSEYAIALQRAIEAHCRGRMADETDMGGCPWHAKMLNRYLTRSADVTDAVVDAAHDAFFADYKNHPRGKWIAKTAVELTAKLLETQRRLDAALAELGECEFPI